MCFPLQDKQEYSECANVCQGPTPQILFISAMIKNQSTPKTPPCKHNHKNQPSKLQWIYIKKTLFIKNPLISTFLE